jgi:hypothetical protein
MDLTCGAANMPTPTWRQLVLSLYVGKLFVQVGKEARLHAKQQALYPLSGVTEGTPPLQGHKPHVFLMPASWGTCAFALPIILGICFLK